MPKLSRTERAAHLRAAAEIRQTGQQADWGTATIAAEIHRQLPTISRLMSWRLAYGWTRPQTVAAIVEVYQRDGLARPGLTTARLCRWEHNEVRPDLDYLVALTRVYGAPPHELGLAAATPTTGCVCRCGRAPQDVAMTDPELAAVADSLRLHRDTEGPAGGPNTRTALATAVEHYAQHYDRYPPTTLASEIHRTRAQIITMLEHPQPEPVGRELRLHAGWLSALLGNLAFHAGDDGAAHLHLSTAARLGTTTGHPALTCWSLGAQAMTALFQHQPAEALELAEQSQQHASTPLQQAQITAWCELRALAALGRTTDAHSAADRARRHMDTATPLPGRFGFDVAEHHQHLAETYLALGDPAAARTDAEQVLELKTRGSGGWAAGTATLARSHAAKRDIGAATALAGDILDAVPPDRLRATTRRRLAALDNDLYPRRATAPAARQLHDRLQTLTPHPPTPRASPEPNGH